MSDDWVKKVIAKACDDVVKNERKVFSIAYAEIPKDYHGYIQELRQSIKVFYKSIPEDMLKELKSEFPVYTMGSGPVFCTAYIPYLGVDGCRKWFNDAHAAAKATSSIVHEVISTPSIRGTQVAIKVVIKSDIWGIREGLSDVVFLDPDDSTQKAKDCGFEPAASAAEKKAYNKFGIGVIGTHSTRYGDSALVEAFRKFVGDKEKENG